MLDAGEGGGEGCARVTVLYAKMLEEMYRSIRWKRTAVNPKRIRFELREN